MVGSKLSLHVNEKHLNSHSHYKKTIFEKNYNLKSVT